MSNLLNLTIHDFTEEENISMSKYALRSPLMKHALKISSRSQLEVCHSFAEPPPESIRNRRRMTFEVPDLKIHEPLSAKSSNSNGEEEDFKYRDDIVNELSSAGSLSPEESPRLQMGAVGQKKNANHAKKLQASLSNIKSPRCLRKFMFRREDAILGSNDDNISHKSSENLVLSPRPLNSTGSSRHSSASSNVETCLEKTQTSEELSMYPSTGPSTDSTSLCSKILEKMEKLDELEKKLKKLKTGDMRLVIKDDTVVLSMGSKTPPNLQRTNSVNMLAHCETKCAYLAYLDYLSNEEELAEALGEYEASMVKRRRSSDNNLMDEEESEDMFPKVHAAAVQRLRRNPRKHKNVN
jgi:hypothetical protein